MKRTTLRTPDLQFGNVVMAVKIRVKRTLCEAISNLSIGVVIFVLLNILLPSVDVITDLLMVKKLFSGAFGCINPRWWSGDFIMWQDCLQDPELYCSENKQVNSTCVRVLKGIHGYSCLAPDLWSTDYSAWRACRDSPTSFCEGAPHTVCQFQEHHNFGLCLLLPLELLRVTW